jgi:hypothetical protein
VYKTLRNTHKSKKPVSYYKEQFSIKFKNKKYGLIFYKIIYSISNTVNTMPERLYRV